MHSILLIEESRLWATALEQHVQGDPAVRWAGTYASVVGARRSIMDTVPSVVAIGLVSRDAALRKQARALIREIPGVRALAYSVMAEEPLDEAWALACGFMGYIGPGDTAAAIMDAVKRIAEGGRYFTRGVDIEPVELRRADDEPADTVQQLSGREIEVFQLLGRGLNSKDIAANIGINIKTVDTYRKRIREKLKVRAPGELLQHAIRATRQTRAA